ncbi:SGNH/GDSL hydrolase family protein [Mucilaginibacter roseus]|uniref:SGNH/GDSL hydrolase family protein n=1 Tax=Mucilaginibacter roseus TaxID=1528868 RepID=A0ABS8U423_9SPHI|nr:SGNH/GDSL hydrolase family protein [Mucilaginibacter roseus]MCD8740624.1 SGNH/GDSL hydrolase family protein [Mucilaginibacter roseus]
MKILAIIITLLSIAGCSKSQPNTEVTNPVKNNPTDTAGKSLSYLALGDSYTIGEAVDADKNFPHQLVSALKSSGLNLKEPQIIARTGWTTDELISAIKEQSPAGKFDIVTLLIGVNNQYRGYNIDTYRTEFITLLNTAIGYANNNKAHVFVLSIPDYGVTPYAQNSDKEKIAREIDSYNAINKQEAEKFGVKYIDITPISRKAANDPELVASDGLHPSAKMYAEWVTLLAPAVANGLK